MTTTSHTSSAPADGFKHTDTTPDTMVALTNPIFLGPP